MTYRYHAHSVAFNFGMTAIEILWRRSQWEEAMNFSALRGVALAAGLLSAAPALAETTLLLNNFVPDGVLPNRGVITPWAQAIERESGGRIKITIPPTSMAPPNEQYNLVVQGVADVAYIFVGFLEKSHGLTQLPVLPLYGESGEATATAFWRTYQKYMLDVGEFKDVKLLGFVAGPPAHLGSLSSPITSIDQLNGAKIFTVPGNPADAMAQAGAVVVPGPVVRAYELISKGTVDYYASVSYGTGKSLNIMQLTKSVTEIPGGTFTPVFAVFMNKAKWDLLGPEDKEVIEGLSGEALAARSVAYDEDDAQARESFVKAGVDIVQAPNELTSALRTRFKPIYDEWIEHANAKGIDGEAARAFYLSELKKIIGKQ